MADSRRIDDWPSSTACTIATICSLFVFSVAGCGPHSDRLAISGKVQLNGTPLDLGSIRFSSVKGEKLYASGAMVKDGSYHVPQSKGLPPGTYRVEINSPDTKAPLVVYRPAPGEPPAAPAAPERIPPEYNTNSKQTVEVSASKNNEFNFEIVAGKST